MTTTVQAEAPASAAGPVIRDDLTAEQYHADKTSVSSSGLRALLAPGCPAQFKYDRDNPRPPKKEFDFGHVAHKLVLGEGDQVEIVDYPDWRTSDARNQRDNAYAEGRIPILTKDYETAAAMAFQVRQHPVAGPLFTPDTGRAELSIFWTDPRTGIRCRCRPDWLPNRQDDNRLVVVDYKTAKAVDPDALARAVYERGYHAQAAHYLEGVKAAGLHGSQEPAFVFVFQSKTAPYLVHLVELDFPALALGAARNERALRIYAECERTGTWPGFNDRITYLPLPAWAERKDHEEYA